MVSSFLSAYLNFYVVVAEKNKLNDNEGTALAWIFCTNKMWPDGNPSTQGSESNEIDANEDIALAQIFREKRTPREP